MGNFLSSITDSAQRKDDHEQEASRLWREKDDETHHIIQRCPSPSASPSPTNLDIFPKYSSNNEDRHRREEDRNGEQQVVKKRDDELKNEIRIKHYSSSHKILLVGEGDFSFSVCLAKAFGTATNMVATSLDTEETLEDKYSGSEQHIRQLRRFGCMVLHDVGVHDMLYDPVLMNMKFDRIVFNFPHAGHFPPFYETDEFLIQMHKKLLLGFFKSSSKMLNEDGEVHVSHRDDYPYNKWDIKKLANNGGLRLIEKVRFRKVDYPGYSNKRGGDIESDKEFYLGDRPYTFKFSSAANSKVNSSKLMGRRT
ncbi:protein of unknown function DUF2431 [Macleaya cordata]|uniref:25S rRNA (uridine-N(3))-methyltransferase BMT5-like domain-containing protein n=1 Tax=Macleaya cordata TaxID=56857 RepID=A0A200RAI7_MACCD|nr:protein of unknown function DUF2431 [Macleaya cordata]